MGLIARHGQQFQAAGGTGIVEQARRLTW